MEVMEMYWSNVLGSIQLFQVHSKQYLVYLYICAVIFLLKD